MLTKERLAALREEMQSLVADGTLLPEVVVEAARNPNSLLHGYFTWDDGEAAEQFRLQEARALIRRVKVQVIRSDNAVVYVPSFTRPVTGAGYQSTQSVTVNRPNHIGVMLITLAQISTMLHNLAAPELDELVEHVDAVRERLKAEQEVA